MKLVAKQTIHMGRDGKFSVGDTFEIKDSKEADRLILLGVAIAKPGVEFKTESKFKGK